MERGAVIGLMGAYGFEVERDEPEQHRTRFRGQNTFIDLWDGRRGLTAGVYSPQTTMMRYKYRLTLEELEDVLITLKK